MNTKKSPFEFVKELHGWRGVAKLYRDARDDSFVIVSRADTLDRGDETMAFLGNRKGEVLDWNEMAAGYGVDHETLLTDLY